MNPKSRARYRVWHWVRNGITNPRTIARKENLKLQLVEQVIEDIKQEGLLKIVQDEYRLKV